MGSKMITKPLSEITSKIGSGSTPRGGKESYKAHGISLVRSLNVYDSHFNYENLAHIDKKQAKKLSNVTLEKGDILLNITGASVARCCIVPTDILPARVNQHVSIIRTNDNANNKYVFYCLVSPMGKARLLNLAQGGATREALTKETLEKFEIELVDNTDTQQKIATILSNYDDLIENNEKRIKVLENIAKLIYEEWFVRFKFQGHEKIKMVDSKTNFGIIPEGWKVENIEKLCEFVSRGVSPKYQEGSGIFAINQKVNKGKKLEIQYLKELNPNLKIPGDKLAQTYDVLINSLGEGTIGRVHLFRGPNKLWAVDQHMTICRSSDKEKNIYLYYKLTSHEGQSKILSVKTGATNMTMLNISLLRNMEFLFPNKELLLDFFRQIDSIYKKIYNLELKNQNLGKTQDLLLPKLISGEIDVSDLDIQLNEVIPNGQ